MSFMLFADSISFFFSANTCKKLILVSWERRIAVLASCLVGPDTPAKSTNHSMALPIFSVASVSRSQFILARKEESFV